MTDPVIVSAELVREHLICEFTHWDCCLTGLVDRDGERMLCRILPAGSYQLDPIEWTDRMEEYLSDYRRAFPHWFYSGGERPLFTSGTYGDFGEKWQKRNPIIESVEARCADTSRVD